MSSTIKSSPKRKRSPLRRKRSPSPVRGGSGAVPRSLPREGEKIKFYDLVARKPFMTSEYDVVTRITSSRNGKRRVTYFVTRNPTPRADGHAFDNWKIFSNVAA